MTFQKKKNLTFCAGWILCANSLISASYNPIGFGILLFLTGYLLWYNVFSEKKRCGYGVASQFRSYMIAWTILLFSLAVGSFYSEIDFADVFKRLPEIDFGFVDYLSSRVIFISAVAISVLIVVIIGGSVGKNPLFGMLSRYAPTVFVTAILYDFCGLSQFIGFYLAYSAVYIYSDMLKACHRYRIANPGEKESGTVAERPTADSSARNLFALFGILNAAFALVCEPYAQILDSISIGNAILGNGPHVLISILLTAVITIFFFVGDNSVSHDESVFDNRFLLALTVTSTVLVTAYRVEIPYATVIIGGFISFITVITICAPVKGESHPYRVIPISALAVIYILLKAQLSELKLAIVTLLTLMLAVCAVIGYRRGKSEGDANLFRFGAILTVCIFLRTYVSLEQYVQRTENILYAIITLVFLAIIAAVNFGHKIYPDPKPRLISTFAVLAMYTAISTLMLFRGGSFG